VVLNGRSKHISYLLTAFPEAAEKIRISFPGETMELKVLGNVVWNHPIHFNGKKNTGAGNPVQRRFSQIARHALYVRQLLRGRSRSRRNKLTFGAVFVIPSPCNAPPK